MSNKISKTASFLVSHVAAGGVSFAALVILPMLIMLAFMIIGNDPGGPMFLPIFFLFCVFYAVCASLCFFALSCLLQWIRRYVRFSSWAPVALIFPFCMAILLVTLTGPGLKFPLVFFLGTGLILSIAFVLYWSVLLGGARIIRWIGSVVKRKG